MQIFRALGCPTFARSRHLVLGLLASCLLLACATPAPDVSSGASLKSADATSGQPVAQGNLPPQTPSLPVANLPAQPIAPVAPPPPPPPPPPVVRVPPRIGLALGGGAARGFAHVGIIQVLEEAGIRPTLVAGTSAGSLVAALYAGGKNGRQLQQIAESMDESTITDWTLPIFNRGMLRGEALARYVNGLLGGRNIDQLPMTLGIVATDLQTGSQTIFQRGDTGTAVRASSAVPAVFQPVRISGHDYVDGGLVSPVPVSAARKMGAELIIAVDISSPPEGNLTGGTLEVLMQTFAIMGKSINAFELRDADVVVRPALLGVSSADFAARNRSIEAGRQAMLLALPQLRAAIAAKTR